MSYTHNTAEHNPAPTLDKRLAHGGVRKLGEELLQVERKHALSVTCLRIATELCRILGTPLSAEAQAEEQALAFLSALHTRSGERAFSFLVAYLLLSEDAEVVPLSRTVASASMEHTLPSGIADCVVWHNDGSCTVVELKAFTSWRETLTGLGQALMYTVDLRNQGFKVRQPLLLVAGDFDEFVASACNLAGVDYAVISRDMVESYTRVSRLMAGAL